MIAVIADDFTGAAELAGICLRYGLRTELCLGNVQYNNADVLIISTDSRSLTKPAAIAITKKTTAELLKLSPEFIFKKIDSVFRGHVLDEIKIQMLESGLKKALIVGGNPTLGRTISNGKFYVNGELLSETDFGNDPEFAISDSSVLKIVKAEFGEVAVMKHTDAFPAAEIIIADISSYEDVTAWTKKVDDNWLLAGAGDFFTALLSKKYPVQKIEVTEISSPHLYVSGTAYNKSQQFVKQVNDDSGCVAYLSAAMMKTGEINEQGWFSNVSSILNKQQKAVIAINDEDVDSWYVSAIHLRNTMARVVKRITEENKIKEIFIEGGSTASSIINEMGIEKLDLINELQRGVVRMKTAGIFITVKPGSYDLPEEIKRLYKTDI